MRQIPLFNPYMAPDVKKELSKTLDSGFIGTGEKVEGFEKAFASYIGTRYAVATNSGSAALHIAARIAGTGQGFAVPSFTYASTAQCAEYLDEIIMWMDIDPETLCCKHIEGRLPLIPIIMHYGGQPCDMDEFGDLHIEDCAHAIGAEFKCRKLGSFGEFG